MKVRERRTVAELEQILTERLAELTASREDRDGP